MREAQILFRSQVDKIVGYKTIPPSEKIDRLLFLNADQYCNLGRTSAIYEREDARSNSRYLYKAIKTLDEQTGTLLLRYRED